jgi:hypothetical protein
VIAARRTPRRVDNRLFTDDGVARAVGSVAVQRSGSPEDGGSHTTHPEDLDLPDATFACPDLSKFRRLDELSLVVTGQRLETAGSGRNYTLPSGTPVRAATLGTSYARAIRPRSTSGNPAAHPQPESRRQLLRRCGGTPCPTIVQVEFIPERCRSARSEEVSPIFVHSRVLAPSRWSL